MNWCEKEAPVVMSDERWIREREEEEVMYLSNIWTLQKGEDSVRYLDTLNTKLVM